MGSQSLGKDNEILFGIISNILIMDIKNILESKSSNFKSTFDDYDFNTIFHHSLGLACSFYPTEIDFYEYYKFMRDFFKNYMDPNTKMYSMGGRD